MSMKEEAAAFFHSNAKRGNMIMLLYVEQQREKTRISAASKVIIR